MRDRGTQTNTQMSKYWLKKFREKKIVEIRKRNFYSEEELLSWRDHVIGESENVNNFIKTSGATENSAIYQG